MTLKLKLTLPSMVLIFGMGLVACSTLFWVRSAYSEGAASVEEARLVVQRLHALSELTGRLSGASATLVSLGTAKAPQETIRQASVAATEEADALLAPIKELKSLDLPLAAPEKASFIAGLEAYQAGVANAVAGIAQDRQGSLQNLQDQSAVFARVAKTTTSVLARVENRAADLSSQTQRDMGQQVADLAAGLAGLSILAVVAAYIAAARALKPLQVSSAAMQQLAEGDCNVVVPYKDRADEIGDMARAIEAFRLNGLRLEAFERREESLTTTGSALYSSIEALVRAAESGDFAGRVTQNFDRDDVAFGINRLMAAMEHGIGEARRVLSALAEGDLTRSMDGSFEGAFGDLQENVNLTAQILRGVLGQAGETVGTIGQMSEEILSGASDLSERCKMQAASIDEIALAIVDITAAVSASAEQSLKARSMVVDTLKGAEQSNTIVGRAVDAMEKIKHASGEIGMITEVIDEIAFQTNILALNAGVEAARAGESGRGFAVVAQEVRELAQRSATAARDIKALIARSSQEVLSGVRLVRETGIELKAIRAQVEQINDYVQIVSMATQEQSAGLEQVSAFVSAMDEMTRKNAAMVEHSTRSTSVLAEAAEGLSHLVSQFRVQDDAQRDMRLAS